MPSQETAEEVSRRAELEAALRARQAQRKEHATRAREHLVDGKHEAASRAFSAAILLSVAATYNDAISLAMSDRWKPEDPKRVELADLYYGRGLAQIRHGDNYAEGLKDAHAANLLQPGTYASLSLYAAAAAGLASLPQEPVSFFTDDPMPEHSAEQSRELAANMTQQLAHGLAADAFSLLSEATDVAEGSAQWQEAIDSRDYHAARSHGGLHPLGDRTLTSRLPTDAAFTMMTMALESLTVEPIDPRASTPKVALLAHTLISLTAYRLGCRESPLSWRPPPNLLLRLSEDRLVEVWLRARAEERQEREQEDEAKRPPKPSPGQHVRIAGLKTRPDLNGRRGEVVAYDPIKGRYKVAVPSAGNGGAENEPPQQQAQHAQEQQAQERPLVRIWLKPQHLVVEAAVGLRGDS